PGLHRPRRRLPHVDDRARRRGRPPRPRSRRRPRHARGAARPRRRLPPPRDGLRPAGAGARRAGGAAMSPVPTGTAPETDLPGLVRSQESTLSTVRRGLALSPELTRGLWVTLSLAALMTLGRV